jgi:hypothetical protein
MGRAIAPTKPSSSRPRKSPPSATPTARLVVIDADAVEIHIETQDRQTQLTVWSTLQPRHA